MGAQTIPLVVQFLLAAMDNNGPLAAAADANQLAMAAGGKAMQLMEVDDIGEAAETKEVVGEAKDKGEACLLLSIAYASSRFCIWMATFDPVQVLSSIMLTLKRRHDVQSVFRQHVQFHFPSLSLRGLSGAELLTLLFQLL